MKKVLIGILILIPIFILLVVALVSNLIQLQAWIAVEDLSVTYKNSANEVTILQLYLDVRDDTVFHMTDWVDVTVTPDQAMTISATRKARPCIPLQCWWTAKAGIPTSTRRAISKSTHIAISA